MGVGASPRSLRPVASPTRFVLLINMTIRQRPAPNCSLRPTNTLNVYVKNLASSGTIPAGWTFTMSNPSYVSLTTFWNMQV